MTKTPWDELLDQLKALYGAEADVHDERAKDIIRNWFDNQYHKGRLAGVVEEAARHRRS